MNTIVVCSQECKKLVTLPSLSRQTNPNTRSAHGLELKRLICLLVPYIYFFPKRQESRTEDLEALTGNSWKQLSSACCQVLLFCFCASPHNNHHFHRHDIYRTSPPLKLNTHNPEKHQIPWLYALMRPGRKQRLVPFQERGKRTGEGRKAPRAEHRLQLQGAPKSVCQQKPRVHSSRGKVRDGPHTAQPPRNRAEEKSSSFSPHQQASHGRKAGSTLSLAGGQRCWAGREQLPESSPSAVGNAPWRYPKAAGGTLFTQQTQGVLPALRYHTAIPGQTALLQ